MKIRFQLALAGIALTASAATAQTFNYSNTEFANGTWTKIVVTQFGGGSTAATAQVTSGGNPGNYLSIQNSSNNEGITTFTFFAGSFFDPSTQGAITSVSLSVDGIRFGSDGQGFAAALRQGGINYVYWAGQNVSSPTSWMPTTWSNITAANFENSGSFEEGPGGISQPDFSLAGGPIQFGFTNSNSASGFRTTSSGYDNFSATVNYTPIPEPSTYAALVGLGALGLAMIRRRRAT